MPSAPYQEKHLNVGNAIFPGFNDKSGIILCGYEWGGPTSDQKSSETRKQEIEVAAACINTFHSKSLIFNSRYDKRLLKWFEAFGHPLGQEQGFSQFDKTILQTNWCDDQQNYVKDYSKFLAEENIQNFLKIMSTYVPEVLVLLGSRLIGYLQHPSVKERVIEIFGQEVQPPIRLQPGSANLATFRGRKFRIYRQSFERTNVICLPHPSGSIGLSDDYIQMFADEIGGILKDYRSRRGV